MVADGDHATTLHGAGLLKVFQELPETLSVECAGLAAIYQGTVAQPHGAEIADALPGGVVVNDGVFVLGWHSHPAAGPWLLKMYLVQSPQLDTGGSHELSESFLCLFRRPGSARARTGRGLRNRNPH